MSSERARSRCPTPSKQSYPDEGCALEVLREIRESLDFNLVRMAHVPVRAYQCSCRRWHLTSRVGVPVDIYTRRAR